MGIRMPRHPFAYIVTSPLKIDIWSDIACPWCYIGKRHLEGGIAALGDDAPEVEIEYHSFELAPDTPVDFEGSEIDFLAGHKGIPVEQARMMIDRVTGIAQVEAEPVPQAIPPGGLARFTVRFRNDPAIRTFHVEAFGQ